MLTRATIEKLDRSELIDLLLTQQQQIADLHSQLDALRRRIDDRNHFTRGSGSGSSSSSSKPKNKKRPGRKPGEGNVSRRQAPDSSSYTSHEHVQRQDRSCLKCAGTLVSDGYETVTGTGLSVSRPWITLVLDTVQTPSRRRTGCLLDVGLLLSPVEFEGRQSAALLT